MNIAIDTETALIEPGNLTPALTCISYAYRDAQNEVQADLMQWYDAHASLVAFSDLAFSLGRKIVGANISYDMAVLWREFPNLRDRIWCLYDMGLISDVQIRQKLIDIANNERKFRRSGGEVQKTLYNLGVLTKLWLGEELNKDDGPRLGYGPLRNVHLSKWTQEQKTYPVDDAVATLLIHEMQESTYGASGFLDDEQQNCRAAFSLHLMSVVGLRTDAAKVAKFRKEIEDDIASKEADLIRSGLLRPDGSRDTKAAKERMTQVCHGQPKLTKGKKDGSGGGNVALDSDTCISTGDPILIAYAEISSDKKILSTDIPLLEAGTNTPIQTRFEVLLSTGRTGSGKGEDEEGDGNVQNIRRKPGIRECYIPRDGYVFIDSDYPMLELHTWAEICSIWLGFSGMAQVLASDHNNDPHMNIASQILGAPLDWCYANKKDHNVKHNRNTAKVANFGLPGGLGVPTFVEYAAKSYKVKISEELAGHIKQTWLNTWPEAKPYFEFINQCNGTIKLPYSGLVRSGMSFTAACNFPFQALGAVIAKDAAYAIARACYVEDDSPLFGSRPVNFIHDQFLIETRDNQYAHDAAVETGRIMRASAHKYLKHVGMRELEPCLCRMWSKDAEAKFDQNGRLIPWAA